MRGLKAIYIAYLDNAKANAMLLIFNIFILTAIEKKIFKVIEDFL